MLFQFFTASLFSCTVLNVCLVAGQGRRMQMMFIDDIHIAMWVHIKIFWKYWILCNFFPCSVCFLLQSYLDSTFYFLSKKKIASHFIFKEEYKSTFFRCQCTVYTKFCGSNNSPNAIWKCTSDSMKILLTATYIDATQIIKHSYSHPKFTYKKLSDRL